jgi:hypothetical protein
MHLKSCQIDGRLLRMGAANFSASCLKRQDNDLIVIERARGGGIKALLALTPDHCQMCSVKQFLENEMGTALVLLTKNIKVELKPGNFEAKPATIIALACHKNSRPKPSLGQPAQLRLID